MCLRFENGNKEDMRGMCVFAILRALNLIDLVDFNHSKSVKIH